MHNKDDNWDGLYALPSNQDAAANDDDINNHRGVLEPIPLRRVKVEAQVVDFMAEVKMLQCYQNESCQPVEAIYHLPLDDQAAVCGFTATYDDGRIVEGVVQEKHQARQAYEQAVAVGKQVNLLESVRRDVFTLRVGNLPVQGQVVIVITYVMTLQARQDAAALVLPTYIAPRYSPPTVPLTPLEAQALASTCSSGSNGFVQLNGLNIQVDVTCRSSITSIASPTHPMDLSISRSVHDDKTARVSLQNIVMDRDIVVLVEEQEGHQPRATVEVSPDGTNMTGVVTFFPQLEFVDRPTEFIFVVDRSGSMCDKMAQTQEALLLFLRALPTYCTFNVVGFGSRYTTLFPESKPYNDETLQIATQYASNMTSNMGGTNILGPLAHIWGQDTPPTEQRQVFVLTDGQVTNDLHVFDLIRQHCCYGNTRACRLFGVGVGRGVSRHLVSGMARAGRGTACFVEEGAMGILRAKVLGQLKQALQPSFDNVTIKWNFPTVSKGSNTETAPIETFLGCRSPMVDQSVNAPKLYPTINPPIFNNEKYLSFAMFSAGSNMPESVTVTCETSDGPLEITLEVSPDEVFAGSFARRLAARSAIAEFEDSRADSRMVSLSADEALQLALANNLASDQTSFIAISEKADVCRRVAQSCREGIVKPECHMKDAGAVG